MKLAGELKGKKGVAFTNKEYEKIMPNFAWVVRDFSLDLVDPQGKPITSVQYLE